MKKLRASIRAKLMLMMLFISFLIVLTGYIIFLSWYISSAYKNNLNISKSVSLALSQNFAKLILLDAVDEAEDITQMLKSFKNIKKVVVFKKDGSVIFTYSSNHKKFKISNIDSFKQRRVVVKNGDMDIFNPLTYQGVKFGYILMDIKTETLKEIMIDDLPLLFMTIFIILFISLILSHYFSKIFTKPIIDLANFLESVNLSDLKEYHIKTVGRDDEFNTLFKKINSMIKRIKEANKKQKIASVAFEIENGMVITDSSFKVISTNRSYEKLTGYSSNDIKGEIPPVFKNMDSKQFKKIKDTLSCSHYWSEETKNIKKDGEVFIEHLTIQPVFDENGKPINYILSFLDVTKQKKTEEKLKYLQEYDALTGVTNKRPTLRIIDEILSKNRGILYCIDIKRFKEINSAYGYETGDMILKEFAKTLKKRLKKYSVLGRVENNKFLVFDIYEDKERDYTTARFIAQNLITIFSKSYDINNHIIHTNIAIGVEICEKGGSAKEYFDKANLALEEAKKSPLSFAFYDKNIQKSLINQMDIYNEILMAMVNGEFELYYQLQYDENEKPYAAESLVRWNHPEKGLVPPGVFIPVIEKTGLIEKFDDIVLRLGCEQLEIWSNTPYLKDIPVAVNIGATHFNSENFVKEVEDIVKRYDFPRKNLKLEITEYSMVEDIDKVSNTMNELKKLGLKISLDDFGTGFSSLQYLLKLPLDQVKIDQTFILNAPGNSKNIAIIKSILLVCEALDLEVIAEGVETKEHFELLKELGCKHYQGYYFAKPKPVRDVEKMVGKT